MALFFEEDAVSYRNSKSFRCGLVVATSECASSDEDDSHSLKDGTIKVAWHPSGKIQVLPASQVSLVDRSLMPGDVVKRQDTNKSPLKGYVQNTRVICHLQILGTFQVLPNVDSKYLTPLMDWDCKLEHTYVTLDGWIGWIDKVTFAITATFQDGARCTLGCNQLYKFEDAFDIAMKKLPEAEFGTCSYYVGQKLCGSFNDLVGAHWLTTTKRHSPIAVRQHRHERCVLTVEQVTTTSVEVQWVCGHQRNVAAFASQPMRVIHKEDLGRLRKLNIHGPSSAILGDQMYYTITESSVVHCLPQPKTGCTLIGSMTASTSLRLGKSAPLEVTDESEYTDVSDDEAQCFDSARVVHLAHTVSGNQAAATANKRSAASSAATVRQRLPRRPARGVLAKMRSTAGSVHRTHHCQARLPAAGTRVPVEIIYTQTACDIVWQDCSIEHNVPSQSLIPAHHIDDHEFFPGDFIIKESDATLPEPKEYGVVQSMDVHRMARVRWMSDGGNGGRPNVSASEYELSVYEICDHPLYDFRPGNIVLRVTTDDQVIEQCCSDDMAGNVARLNTDGTMRIQWSDGCAYDCFPGQLLLIEDMADMHESERSSAIESTGESGEGTDSEDGWSSCDSSESHDEFDGIDDEDCDGTDGEEVDGTVDEDVDGGDDEDIDNADDEDFDGTDDEDIDGTDDEDIDDKSHSEISIRKYVRPEVETNAMLDRNKTADTSECFSADLVNPNMPNSAAAAVATATTATPVVDALSAGDGKFCQPSVFTPDGLATVTATTQAADGCGVVVESVREAPGSVDSAAKSGDSATEVTDIAEGCCSSFPSQEAFALLTCRPDWHHYFRYSGDGFHSNDYLAGVKREFKLLSTSLPPGIYVRGSDSRLDLLSAMIIGSEGTPYEDGVFLFDLHLKPGEWPMRPPRVHYHSYCAERLNPNLYEEGKVCVSLLGTWSGNKDAGEVWSSSSTLLQLLVSIQGLILVKEPYYNEAGYERQKGTTEGRENSKLYNEMVIVRLVQSMCNLTQKTQPIFGKEIKDHFSQRGAGMVHRLTQWVQCDSSNMQLPTGENQAVSAEFPLLPPSKGFAVMLQKQLQVFQACLNKLT